MTELDLGTNAPLGYRNYCASVASAGSLECDSDSLLFFSSWQTDSRDNMIFPTAGYKIAISADITAPIFDMQYFKISTAAEKFFPHSENITTRIKGSLGYADSYGDEIYPFFKNFTAGGSSSVRGYKQGSIGAKVFDSVYGDYVTYGGQKRLHLARKPFFRFLVLKILKVYRS
mgnify:CR=1 FL=1